MCRLCNLFSPSHTQLLTHCSLLHPQQEPADDIIITLQPLAGDPSETPIGQFNCKKSSWAITTTTKCVKRRGKKSNNCVLAFYPLLSFFSTESLVKRKRGRPKGSTKKVRVDWAEGTPESTDLSKENAEKEDQSKNMDTEQQGSSVESYSGMFNTFTFSI